MNCKMDTIRVSLMALLAVAFVGLASGCGTDDPGDSLVTSCTTDTECGVGRYCGDDNLCTQDCTNSADCTAPATCSDSGRCVVPGECQNDGDCAEPPASTCDGDFVVTYSAQGTCEIGATEATCSYTSSRTPCELGCVDGACASDICETTVCDDAPEDVCDGDILVSYQSQGVCSAGMCDYPDTRRTCPLGCANGACNDGTCDNVTCDEPPPAACDGDVVETYSGTGTCVDDDGSAECINFDIDFEHCGYTKSSCSNAECGTPVTQVGGVVIVEVFPDPIGSFGDSDEWFEIVNVSGADIDLQDWKIRSGASDGSTEEHVIGGEGQIVPPFPNGGRLLLSRSSQIFETNIGIDYNFDGDIGLGNGSDWLEIVNPGDEIVDYLFWEAGSILEGRSRKLSSTVVPDAELNDDFNNWCPEMADAFDGDNFGTPGAENPACSSNPCAGFTCEKPAGFCRDDVSAVDYQFAQNPPVCETTRFNNPLCEYEAVESTCDAETELCSAGICESFGAPISQGDVIFTEFLPNPGNGVSDADGEYFELYNTTSQEVVLFGNFFDVDGRTQLIDNPDARIAPNGYLVFIRDTDPAVNGGVNDAVELSGGFTLNNGTADTIVLQDRMNGPVASGTYEASSGSSAPENQAYQLRFDGTQYVDGEWCYTPTQTPGADNLDLTCN